MTFTYIFELLQIIAFWGKRKPYPGKIFKSSVRLLLSRRNFFASPLAFVVDQCWASL